jgi:uncharacterized membrane protein YkvA (DUF1232 family)
MRVGKVLKKWQEKAGDLLNQPDQVMEMVERSRRKFQKTSLPSFKELRDDFATAIAMVKAYVRGEYRSIPWSTILVTVAGLLYFLNPLDAIPDFIPFKGLLDDAAILVYVFNTIREDLQRFQLWRRQQNSTPGDAAGAPTESDRPQSPDGSEPREPNE